MTSRSASHRFSTELTNRDESFHWGTHGSDRVTFAHAGPTDRPILRRVWARSLGVERCRRHSFAQERRAIGVAESRGDTVCRFVELAVQARADDFLPGRRVLRTDSSDEIGGFR